MNDNVTLSAPQRRAIAALMTAKDTRAAARIASVSERRLYRWLTLPAFVVELKSARVGGHRCRNSTPGGSVGHGDRCATRGHDRRRRQSR